MNPLRRIDTRYGSIFEVEVAAKDELDELESRLRMLEKLSEKHHAIDLDGIRVLRADFGFKVRFRSQYDAAAFMADIG